MNKVFHWACKNCSRSSNSFKEFFSCPNCGSQDLFKDETEVIEHNTNWQLELEEHKAFINHLGLYVCDCLDNKTSVEEIKNSLNALVDHEVAKMERLMRGKKL